MTLDYPAPRASAISAPSRIPVLVVDDDPIMREILSELLGSEGYDVAVAEDGEIAIAWLEKHTAALVVLDMIMPNKEGIETLMEIKKRWPATRVMMISAGTRAMQADPLLHTALSLGADDAVSKPIQSVGFLARVASLLAPVTGQV